MAKEHRATILRTPNRVIFKSSTQKTTRTHTGRSLFLLIFRQSMHKAYTTTADSIFEIALA